MSTVIEKDTTFRGSLETKSEVVVHGTMEGDLKGTSLAVSAGGAVKGNVEVDTISSHGDLQGEFRANHIELGGRIRDNTKVHAKTLETVASSDGALPMFGECTIEVGEVPGADEVVKGSSKRSQAEAKPAQAEAKPAGAEAKPAQAEAKPAGANPASAEAQKEPTEAQGDAKPKAAQADAKPSEPSPTLTDNKRSKRGKRKKKSKSD